METNRKAGSLNIQKKTRAFTQRKVLLAILSGVMLTTCQPPVNLSFVAWFALLPLLIGINDVSPKGAFRLGLIAGFVHYLTLIYWIVVVLGRYGGLNVFSSLGSLLILCLYLALFPAFFSSLIIYAKDSRFIAIFMASLWVALEYLRAHLLSGFPWCLLGYSQYQSPHLIQIADLCGVYGLTFLVVLINGTIFRLFFGNQKGSYRSLIPDILVAAILIGGTLVYGQYRLTENGPHNTINAVIIQANIDQSIKWDPLYRRETMATYKRLTLSTCNFKPDLIVWPETSIPFFLQNNRDYAQKLFNISKESGAIMVFGSPAYKVIKGEIKYYNRVYQISPDERPLQYYDKIHLVPFGEYVPLKKFLFFINRLVPAAGDFMAGDKISPLSHDNLSIGNLICFEAIFPELARAHAKKGANILINVTNDAWFGKTSAPYQHLSMALFRSVENRLPMIRAANTGFSAFISPKGEILSRGALFSEEVLRYTINIPSPAITFYARFGDLFAHSLCLISFIYIFFSIRKRMKMRYLLHNKN